MADKAQDLASQLSELSSLLSGEATKQLLQQGGHLIAKYSPLKDELRDLLTSLSNHLPTLDRVHSDAMARINPHYLSFSIAGDMDGISLSRFLETIGGSITRRLLSSTMALHSIQYNCEMLLPVLEGEKKSLGDMEMAEEAASNLLSSITQEFLNTVVEWDKLVAGVYLGTRKEYKKLRRKYLGESANKAEDKDSTEDDLLSQLFGMQRPKEPTAMGPAIALIDDNVILTELLSDLANSLPRYYEKTTPVVRKGKVTNRTETKKHLDEGEVEDAAATFIKASHSLYLSYAKDPEILLRALMDVLKRYYSHYFDISNCLRSVVIKSGQAVHLPQDVVRKTMVNPVAIAQKYAKINFLAIRPNAEDIAPKTRVEKEYAAARTKLLTNLKETITILSTMDGKNDDTEKYATLRVKEAITLKQAMDDVVRTERDKHLSRNIQDDNEFYIGVSGNLGSLSYEREPAPKITYDDVIGESFISAKAHIEEVVKVASHPHVMRASAPRGDIKSNLMMIGPYGCGKTEMARAVGSDKRIIGFNVATADLLTAYMHESVKNIKRMYDAAKEMRRKSRYTKPVGILLDEFDRLFSYGEGVHAAYDGKRMEGTIQEMMDGVVGYEGVFLVAMTNIPKAVPEAILRRFKFVDVVGQLTVEERVKLFKMFLGKGLPLSPAITEEHWTAWGTMLDHAPGDVIGKVADEIHFKFMKEFADKGKGKMEVVERALSKRLKNRDLNDKDRKYVRDALSSFGFIGLEEVDKALAETLNQPQVKMQINKAKQVYKDAEDIKSGLADVKGGGLGFGAQVTRRSETW